MADFSLSAGSYPSGNTVKAFPSGQWTPAGPPSGAPAGTEDASATANADGSVDFTGLTEGSSYFAYSLVGSEHRYIRFSVPAATGGGSSFAHLVEDTDDGYTILDMAGNSWGGLFVGEVDADSPDWSQPLSLLDRGHLSLSPAAAEDFALNVNVAGDANQRLRVGADGSLHWGDGTAAPDTHLGRLSSGALYVGDTSGGYLEFDGGVSKDGYIYAQDAAGAEAITLDTSSVIALDITKAGAGIRLTSLDGLSTKRLRLANGGAALELV